MRWWWFCSKTFNNIKIVLYSKHLCQCLEVKGPVSLQTLFTLLPKRCFHSLLTLLVTLFSVHQVAPFHNNQFINGFTTSHSFKPATSPLTVRHYSPRNRFVSVLSLITNEGMENKQLLIETFWEVRYLSARREGRRRRRSFWFVWRTITFRTS